MNRLPDWERRADLWLARAARLTARDGEIICALWVADAVLAMTGVDHAARYRSAETVDEGLAMLRSDGFADHLEYVAHLLPEIDPATARAGDVGATGDGALVLFQTRAAAIGPGPRGVAVVPRSQIIRGWRV